MSASTPLKQKYARIGPWYDLLDAPWEYLRYRKIRPIVWREVAGRRRILDAGTGTGRNAPYYPASAQVVGVDLSWEMLSCARPRPALPGRPALVQGDAVSLPFRSATFDAVVSTFLFCVLPDELQPTALAEVARVLKPGAPAILLEYQYSADPLQRAIMKAMSPWVEWAYGARFDRRTVEHLRAGGWRIEKEVFLSKDIVKLIVAARPKTQSPSAR